MTIKDRNVILAYFTIVSKQCVTNTCEKLFFLLYRWEPGSVVNLAAMFKDVPLTSDELKFVIEKVLRMFGDLELSDIPALVYQLLLLCTKVRCLLLILIDGFNN